MAEKKDPIKLAAELEVQLGARMDEALKEEDSYESGVKSEEIKKITTKTKAMPEKFLTKEPLEEAQEGIGRLNSEQLAAISKKQAEEKQAEEKEKLAAAAISEAGYDVGSHGEAEITKKIEPVKQEAPDIEGMGFDAGSHGIEGTEEKKESSAEKTEAKETEEEKEKRNEKMDKELEAARKDYVTAWSQREKAKKDTGKLSKLKEFFGVGKKTKDEKAAVEEEKNKAETDFLEKQKTWSKAFKERQVSLLEDKKQELTRAGKSSEEIEKLIAQHAKELVAAAAKEASSVDSLKSDQQIEQMGKWRKGMNEKVSNFMGWYKELPLKGKMAVSAGLLATGIAGGLVGSAFLVSASLGGGIALRALGGALTVGSSEQLMKGSQEKSAGKRTAKEFEGKFLEVLKDGDDQLEKKLVGLTEAKEGEKKRRFLLAGTLGALVGSGALGYAVRNAMDWWKGSLPGGSKAGVVGLEQPSAVKPPIQAVSEKLAIGSRGPEGAVIDHFKANPQAAKAFGWDGKSPIEQWSGTKAHQLWLEQSGKALQNPETLAEIKKLGFSTDANGYAKMMHQIGKGFVELNPKTGMSLTDASYFKASALAGEGADLGTPSKALDTSLPSAEGVSDKVAQAVEARVNPEFYWDKVYTTYKDKLSLGQLLEDFPREVTHDKDGLGRMWNSIDPNLKPLSVERYGSLSYGDAQKLSEAARFLRDLTDEKLLSSDKLGETMGEFFEKYRHDFQP